MVSASEARKALREIIDDRKTLSQEISALKTRMQEKLDEPSKKVKHHSLLLIYYFLSGLCSGFYHHLSPLS